MAGRLGQRIRNHATAATGKPRRRPETPIVARRVLALLYVPGYLTLGLMVPVNPRACRPFGLVGVSGLTVEPMVGTIL